uniref:Transmembrane protein 154 n=1 Tax=Ailuropoda melanoleuca TaxID=9646 RepID=A0A7N5KL34_AILME
MMVLETANEDSRTNHNSSEEPEQSADMPLEDEHRDEDVNSPFKFAAVTTGAFMANSSLSDIYIDEEDANQLEFILMVLIPLVLFALLFLSVIIIVIRYKRKRNKQEPSSQGSQSVLQTCELGSENIKVGEMFPVLKEESPGRSLKYIRQNQGGVGGRRGMGRGEEGRMEQGVREESVRQREGGRGREGKGQRDPGSKEKEGRDKERGRGREGRGRNREKRRGRVREREQDSTRRLFWGHVTPSCFPPPRGNLASLDTLLTSSARCPAHAVVRSWWSSSLTAFTLTGGFFPIAVGSQPCPIFEEDTPSVMEIEMEELDKWMNSMNRNADCECLPTLKEEKESNHNPSDNES